MKRHCRSFPRLLFLIIAVAAVALISVSAQAQNPEYRAFWVDAWHAGALNQSQVDKLLGVVGDPNSKGDVRNANCNAVFVQVRRNADVAYPSGMVPPEPYMSGLTPSDFNALQAVINAAHDTTGGKSRVEVHAWIVVFRTSGGVVYELHNDPPTGSLTELDNYWITRLDTGAEPSNKGFDPGHPLAEEYLVNVAMDIVNNFDIDGIHYDYIRFYSNNEGYNPTSVARYNARYGLTGQPAASDEQWKQWRRDQVTAFVRKTYAKIQASKPWVKQSGAFVTWNPSPTSSTRTAFQATRPYYDVYSDWDSWVQEGIVDIAVPMTYYDLGGSYAADYTRWMNFEKDRKFNRHMVVGPGLYLNSLSNAILELQMTRDASPAGNYAHGFCGYSYFAPFTYGGTSYGTWAEFAPELVANVTPTPVSIPVMPWKTSPTKGHISGTVTFQATGAWADGATVTLTGPESRTQRCDGTGFYAFIDLTPGSYTVTASASGYTAQAPVSVQIGAVTGNMYIADLALGTDPPPVISNVRAENVAQSTADIKWSTDIPATSQVDYGTTVSYGYSTTLDSSLVTSHTVALSGLAPGQLYHYRVRSKNSAGAESVSGDYTFTTAVDPTPPVISNVQVASVSYSDARITWTTDDYASSQVQYGLTPSYGQSTTEDPTLVTSHSVLVTGLSPNTTYHFRVKSTNGASLTSYSGDYMFTTTSVPSEIIIDDLQAVLVDGLSPYTWSTGAYPGGWPTDASSYRYCWNHKNVVDATCTWTPDLPVTCAYDVYVWYVQGSNRTRAAQYTIHHAGGDTTVNVDQRSNGSQWFKIGSSVQFNAGTDGYVRLTNRTTETTQTVVVIADAVRFVPVDTTAPSVPQDLQATATSTSGVSLTWTASSDNTGVAGYKVFRDSVQVGTSATTSYSDSGLTANTQYTYTVSAYDGFGNESGQSSPASRYTWATPPSAETITCDRSVNTWYNTAPFVFTNSGFGPGKVDYYRFAWDTSPTRDWTGSESTWAVTTKTCNATTSSTSWYFHVRGYNGDAIPTPGLDLGPYRYDGAAPTVNPIILVWYVPKYSDSFEDLGAKWDGSDAESGIAEYQYAIGTSAGATDILGWTSTQPQLGYTSASHHYADALLHDYFYYWSVKARDAAGNWSEPVTSHWQRYAFVYPNLAQAMNNPDSTPVILDSNCYLVVSAIFGDTVFAQQTDRARGIRLDYPGLQWQVGNLAVLQGTLGTMGGERILGDVTHSAYSVGSGGPRPLAIAIRALGGGPPDPYTPGIPGKTGSYNVGLLVRVTGRVGVKDSGSFELTDGSGGWVKVYSSVVPPDNGFVGATGVVSVEDGAAVLRTRGADDVQIY